jgi:dienelactone hydrolase
MLIEHAVSVPTAAGPTLDADLALPDGATGVVVFAHGTGSSRHSPRNRLVADGLQRRGLATLLLDLLTVDEEQADQLRFDIDLLAERLSHAVAWAQGRRETAGLPLGLFGASTGAAAALVCAARHPAAVVAVVSRGGRADLARDSLAQVRAPTLLVVGAEDEVVLDLNRRALAQLPAGSALEVVPGAAHLFEEPGALETVADLAGGWFAGHLVPDHADRRP